MLQKTDLQEGVVPSRICFESVSASALRRWSRIRSRIRRGPIYVLNTVHGAKAAARIRSLVRGNEFLLIPLALVIGCFAGVAVASMSWAAHYAHVAIYGIPLDVRLSANSYVNPLAALVAPAIGGLLLGWMEWYRRRWKISSAADPVEANALRGGNMSIRDSLVVSGQTLLSNGCGASVGLEAGYTQIGAGAASLLGRVFNLRRSDLRLMVGCGAAGAIAAAFNAPLTGAFYACELIISAYSVSSAAPILVASLSASYVSALLGGAPYALNVPNVSVGTLGQSTALIVLAVLVSIIGILVMHAAALVERIFNQKWLPIWLRPVLGGLCVGSMAIYTPQVLAAGHGAMALDLGTQMAATLIIAIASLKLLACIVSLASGFRGGMFFASLFVGCLLGKLYALALETPLLGLNLHLDATTTALTGMATLGVAIVGGPLTMAFLVLEMTRSFEVAAAALAACIVTSVVVRGAFGYSFSTWRLHLRGETIRSPDDVGWIRSLTVKSMMGTDAVVIKAETTIADCRRLFHLGSHQAIFVVDQLNCCVGVALLPDIFAGKLDLTANEITVAEVVRYAGQVLYPLMNVKTAIRTFESAEADVLPVVESVTNFAVVGFLNESYARRRYIQELDRATESIAQSSFVT